PPDGAKAVRANGGAILSREHRRAGGNIGAARAAQSPPDGYTILVSGGNHVDNPRCTRTWRTIPSRISIPSPSPSSLLRCSPSTRRCLRRRSGQVQLRLAWDGHAAPSRG